MRAAQLTARQKARCLEFLRSKKPGTRAAAYRACRDLGEDGKPVYKGLLLRAREVHREDFRRVLSDAGAGKSKFQKAFAHWDLLRGETLRFILTDHKKAAAAQAQLDADYKRLEVIHYSVGRHAAKAVPGYSPLLEPASTALVEFSAELAYCDPEGFRGHDTLEDLLADVPGGVQLLEQENGLKRWKRAEATRAAVEAHNRAQKWAGPDLQRFTEMLNHRRQVVGLAPLRLDQRLSDASLQHSSEMASLGYFSHDSPVEEFRTPGRRARVARFEGGFTGECIYHGGGRSHGAFMAWWYSDGHRVIMFARRPNTLGIGEDNPYWTLMTGIKRWGGGPGEGAR